MVNSKKIIGLILDIGQKIEEQKEYLTELDNIIGDGDHGINMARGFAQVARVLPSMEDRDIGAILKAVGVALVSTVGGASGPLYGSAFMKAGIAVGTKTELDGADFTAVLDAMIEGVAQRGKAQQGEKTILDCLIPARDAYAESYQSSGSFSQAIHSAVVAGAAGVEYTKTIIATKGRASYLGERSLGHQDPGATSSLLMLKVLCDNVQ